MDIIKSDLRVVLKNNFEVINLEDKKTLGKFLSVKRKEEGLSQKQLAAQLYVTESAISKWERGISYPDITMISGICSALGITEHELCTATEDHRHHETVKMAENYKKITRAYRIITALCYAAALIPCFIVNIVQEHKPTWFFILLTSLMLTFSLLNLPMAAKKHKAFSMLCCAYGSLMLLLLTCNIYYSGDWFIMAFLAITFSIVLIFLPFIVHMSCFRKYIEGYKGLICMGADTFLLYALITYGCYYCNTSLSDFKEIVISTLALVILPWIYFAVIRYVKISAFFKTSILLATTALWTFTINGVLNIILNGGSFYYSNYDKITVTIISLSLLAIAIIFAVTGVILYYKEHKESKQ